ncbi:MAG: hypothetical protein PVI78_05640 [Anaerolineales bacterium]|jgi:[acyl-carrier-protein] S-malonyltransferase
MLTAAAIRQELAVQITERLRWTESMQNMIANGINTVIELGPGNTLSSMMKRIDSNVRAVAIDEPDSFAMLDRQDDHKTKAET